MWFYSFNRGTGIIIGMRVASYNVLSGGFDSYDKDIKKPKRLERLKEAIKIIDADFIGLIDTARWDSLYSNSEIAKLFGYKSAYCINLEDERLKKIGHNNGITVLTNLEVNKYETINLVTRDAIRASVLIDGILVDIFSVYLDDLSEDTRIIQVNKLMEYIDSKTPSIIMGDLNSIKRLDLNLLNPLIDKFFQNNPGLLEGYEGVINDMKRGNVIEILEAHGLKDCSIRFSPTQPTKIFPAVVEEPVLRVDYAFVSSKFKTYNFRVLRDSVFDQTSDHYPIVFDCSLS